MRTEVKARILALPAEERACQERAIHGRFTQLPGLSLANTILLYASHFPEEFATWPLMDHVLASGRRLVCPRVDGIARRLDLLLVANPVRDFDRPVNGLPEPSITRPRIAPDEVDWVLVPGLAFDGRGFRLGRGGGFYDRLLPGLRSDCPRWSLAFDEQWVDEVPIEPHDQPLTGVASPSRSI